MFQLLRKIQTKLKDRRGFTLIEMLVVIAVISILTMVAVPNYIGIVDRAKVGADQATMATIRNAGRFYYAVEGEWPGGLNNDEIAKKLSDLTTDLGDYIEDAANLVPAQDDTMTFWVRVTTQNKVQVCVAADDGFGAPVEPVTWWPL